MIDPEVLLVPFEGKVPSGTDLRNPNLHTDFRDARAGLTRARQRAEQVVPGEAPDWDDVIERCGAILMEHSKDLEVASWLAEALAAADGLSGLAEAATVITGLAERFWPTLYPAPFEDEPDVKPEEARIDPLDKLAGPGGRLLPAIRRLPLLQLDDDTVMTYADCLTSRGTRPEDRAKRINALPPDQRQAFEKSPAGRLWDDVVRGLRPDPRGFVAEKREEAAAALKAWTAVGKIVRQQPGGEGFSCEPVTAMLADIRKLLTEIVPEAPTDTPVPAQEPEAMTDPQPEAAPRPVAQPPAAARPLATRDDALRQLEEISAFLRRTEPHSPLAYTLEEAIRRARLSWPDWLAEAVPDPQQRRIIRERLGLPAGTD